MSKQAKIDAFRPDDVAVNNNNFIGLPFNEEEADIILYPVPWDATVSYNEGTHKGPENILNASYQLDLYDDDVPNGWKMGYYFVPPDEEILKLNQQTREISRKYIQNLEDINEANNTPEMESMKDLVNQASKRVNEIVYRRTSKYLNQGKIVGLIGGEHSTPLGFYRALAEKYEYVGIICVDAHLDLRKSYEGFTFSHASIYYNALQLHQIKKLVQVGIRDCAQGEVDYADRKGNRVEPFFDSDMREQQFKGETWDNICKNIADRMPDNVIVSIDIDGLSPVYCPNTGTPVPGGLEYQELMHLLRCIPERGRRIVGFDVCEVGGEGDWDGNVGARIVYKLGNLAGKSCGKAKR